jgi:hypothetical protein
MCVPQFFILESAPEKMDAYCGSLYMIAVRAFDDCCQHTHFSITHNCYCTHIRVLFINAVHSSTLSLLKILGRTNLEIKM